MISFFAPFARLVGLAGLVAAAFVGPAAAHPHVFVDARVEAVFDGEGRIVALRQVWRFDDAFSAFATQGLDTDGDGILTIEELKPLAKVNIDSLKDYDYFTTLRSGGRRVGFKIPTEYWLQMNDGYLTLFYTLNLMQPVKPSPEGVTIDVYDPSYFVDYQLVEQEPARLIGAPAACKMEVKRKGDPDAATAAILGQIPATERELPASLKALTAELANRVTVRCP
ncbi:DUF1007 family protein [Siculibacillus lacustris]|uniref:DUF1007 family protein n=1 Tax=Siculibacillus lacustris TaxID=1549641 RepID=A0A4Q9VXV1_9HYPH|nr:DUF1007 family protein [Siculibacillus lacustris]TBW40767.1 DUF1007 family protein [Siculibacillus lacustris]